MAKSCNPGPLFLRLALGAIFIIRGLGKVSQTMPMKGDDAAMLANMGYLTPVPMTTTTTPPISTPSPKDAKPAGSSGSSAAPNPPEANPKSHSARPIPTEPLAAVTPPLVNVQTVSQAGKTYTADDFPDPVPVKQVYGLAVMLKKSASGVDADGKPVMRLWPQFVAGGAWPVYFAWMCALTELIGGIFLVIGFATRLMALALAFNMGVAMWLTEIGPAVQQGTAKLGFLPDHPMFSRDWTNFFFQGTLFMACLALLCLGCGALGMDNILFPPPAPPAKPKPENAPAH